MSNLLSIVTGGVGGIAVGEAASSALEPVFEPVKQDAWLNAASKVLEPEQLAMLVATALLDEGSAGDEAKRSGIGTVEFNKLVNLALKVPGAPDAEKLYLRAQGGYPGAITAAQLNRVYAKSGIEYQYWDALTAAAQNQLLTPAQIALGIIRSVITDPGFIPGGPYDLSGKVPAYQAATLDPILMAQAAGISEDLLRVMVGSIGLPPSVQQLASMVFRGIIEQGDYNRGVAEGDARPEWGPYWLEQARQILTAHDWVEGRLRGWVATDAEMYAGTAMHGMTQANTDLLFKITGRPLNIHQLVTAEARGGVYNGPTDAIPDEYLAAVRESNIRPEFYNLDYANRYTYPSGFQIKAEATAGVLDETQTEQLLLQIGWDPTWAKFFATAWTATTSTANKHVTSSTTSLVTAARKAYVGKAATQAQAADALTAAGLDPGVQSQLFALWDAQRTLEALPTPPLA